MNSTAAVLLEFVQNLLVQALVIGKIVTVRMRYDFIIFVITLTGLSTLSQAFSKKHGLHQEQQHSLLFPNVFDLLLNCTDIFQFSSMEDIYLRVKSSILQRWFIHMIKYFFYVNKSLLPKIFSYIKVTNPV